MSVNLAQICSIDESSETFDFLYEVMDVHDVMTATLSSEIMKNTGGDVTVLYPINENGAMSEEGHIAFIKTVNRMQKLYPHYDTAHYGALIYDYVCYHKEQKEALGLNWCVGMIPCTLAYIRDLIIHIKCPFELQIGLLVPDVEKVITEPDHPIDCVIAWDEDDEAFGIYVDPDDVRVIPKVKLQLVH